MSGRWAYTLSRISSACPIRISRSSGVRRLKELAALKRLPTLNLGGTKVSDAGLQELAGLKSLQSLYLDATQVTDAGLKEMRKALPGCKITR